MADLEPVLVAELGHIRDLGGVDGAIHLQHGLHELVKFNRHIFLPEDDFRRFAVILRVGPSSNDKRHPSGDEFACGLVQSPHHLLRLRQVAAHDPASLR